jgi:hypothetical protein
MPWSCLSWASLDTRPCALRPNSSPERTHRNADAEEALSRDVSVYLSECHHGPARQLDGLLTRFNGFKERAYPFWFRIPPDGRARIVSWPRAISCGLG